MANLAFAYLFIFSWLTVAYLVIYRLLVKKQKIKFLTRLKAGTTIIVCAIVVKLYHDCHVYFNFNTLSTSEISGMTINNKAVPKKRQAHLLNELKIEEFILIDHPRVTAKYLLTVYTKSGNYNFTIEKTSNQGTLITRVKESGSEYLTYRNNNIATLLP
jgi:hypothetical protein